MMTSKSFTILLLTSLLSYSLTACAYTPGTGNIQITSAGENSVPISTEVTNTSQTKVPLADSSQEPDKPEEPDNEGSSYFYGSSRSGPGRWRGSLRITKYTQADYDLAVSFCTDDYQNKPVAEFDQSVMDWNDEEDYHRMEDTLRRLFYSLPDDDKNAGFILGTLSNTWNACEKKHYETCDREKNPWHESYSEYETYGDVYGDQVLLTGAYAYIDFDYIIGDETAITVGERDTMLESASMELSRYMGKQPDEKLRDEDSMEKTLETELKKYLLSMGDGNLVWGGQFTLSYWWDAPWEWYLEDYLDEYKENNNADKEDEDEEDEEKPPRGYTQEQYNEVLEKFKASSYQDMSVAEFNRMVNDLLSTTDNKEDERFIEAFEHVCSYIDDEDPNYHFLNSTIPMALREYEARACSVYSGKQCDPIYYDHFTLERTDDVFGDQVMVEILEATYTLTYHISDADKLTVGQRDLYFDNLKKEAGEILKEAMNNGEVTEKDFENAILKAGQKAGNDLISLNKCKPDYLYTENFQ